MTYKQTANGVGVLLDGTYIPQDPDNKDYADYLVAAGDDDFAQQDADFDLPTAKAAAKATVDTQAEEQRLKHISPEAGASLVNNLAIEEAKAAADVGTPTAGAFPILNSLVGVKGGDIAAVATTVTSDAATLRTSLAGIEGVAAAAKQSIDSQSNQVGIDGVLSSIVWP